MAEGAEEVEIINMLLKCCKTVILGHLEKLEAVNSIYSPASGSPVFCNLCGVTCTNRALHVYEHCQASGMAGQFGFSYLGFVLYVRLLIY